jgi:hypothetical protein
MDARVELPSPASPDVDAAIMRVLDAEQGVRAEVERCRRDAERRIEIANRRAREIAERAARRVARVHHWTDRAIAARLGALETERAGLLRGFGGDDDASVASAVEALAGQLSGGAE